MNIILNPLRNSKDQSMEYTEKNAPYFKALMAACEKNAISINTYGEYDGIMRTYFRLARHLGTVVIEYSDNGGFVSKLIGAYIID